jgi:hypothetical protein
MSKYKVILEFEYTDKEEDKNEFEKMASFWLNELQDFVNRYCDPKNIDVVLEEYE